MRIPVDTIPEEGLVVEADLDTGWASKALSEAVDARPDALELKVKVERLADHVRVSGDAQGSVVRSCDRCGEPVRLHLGGPIDLYYAPENLVDEGNIELSADELDIGWFDGEALDLGLVLTEQFALWAPSRVRCGDRGVDQLPGPHPCGLPAEASSGGDVRARSPFAKLRLPE